MSQKSPRFVFPLLVMVTFLCQSPKSVADMFYYGSEIAINQGGGDLYFDAQRTTANPDWNGYNLGSYNLLGGSSLILKGGGIFVYRNDSTNYINTNNNQTLFYSIYQGATAGTFTAAQLLAGSGGGTTAFLGGNDFQGYNFGLNTNLGTSLNTSGAWNIAVYFYGNASYDASGVQQFFPMGNYSNNGGSNYVANISAFYGATTTGAQASAFTGSGNFNFNGSGQTYTLNVANSYSGETQIDAGTVAVTGVGTLGTSTVYIGNGGNALDAQLTLNGTVPTISNNIVSNVSSASGTRTIRKEGSTEQTLSGSVTLNRNLAIFVDTSSSLVLSGSINTNTLTLDKFGDGTLTLSNGSNNGSNRYYLGAGTLNVSSEGNLGNRGTVGEKLYFDGGTLNATSTFTIQGNNEITFGNSGGRIGVASGQTLTIQSYIKDNDTANNLIKSGPGTLFLDKAGVNDFSHTTIRVYEGTLNTWNPGGLLSRVVQLGDTLTSGTYRFGKTDGAVTANVNFSIAAGGGTIRVTADPLTLTGNLTGSGTFTKTGNGTLTLSGASNTHSGAVVASEGGLALTAALPSSGYTLSGGNMSTSAANQLADSATVAINSGTLSLGGSDAVGAISGSGGTLNLGSNTLTTSVSAGSSSFSGTITGTGGGLTKSGSGELILAGTSNYTGSTSVSAGTLRVNGSLGATAVSVSSGATLGGNATISGAVTLNNGGTLAPGNSVGTMNLNGGLTLNSGGNVTMEITGPSTFDRIIVTGGSGISYGGVLYISLGGFTPAYNSTYGLFDGARVPSTNFSSILFSDSFDGTGSTFNPVDGTLTVVPEPSTWALIGVGAAFVLWRLRRRKA